MIGLFMIFYNDNSKSWFFYLLTNYFLFCNILLNLIVLAFALIIEKKTKIIDCLLRYIYIYIYI